MKTSLKGNIWFFLVSDHFDQIGSGTPFNERTWVAGGFWPGNLLRTPQKGFLLTKTRGISEMFFGKNSDFFFDFHRVPPVETKFRFFCQKKFCWPHVFVNKKHGTVGHSGGHYHSISSKIPTSHVGIEWYQSRIRPLDISPSGSINRNLFWQNCAIRSKNGLFLLKWFMIGLDDIRVPKRHQKEHEYNKKVWFLFEKPVISHSATKNPTRRVVFEWASKAKNPHSKLKIRWNPTPLVGISRSHYPRIPLVVLTLVRAIPSSFDICRGRFWANSEYFRVIFTQKRYVQ